MTRRRVALAIAVAVAAAAVGVGVLAVHDRAERPGQPYRIAAEGVLSPPMLAFGDTLTARVDVTLDRRRIDPSSVRVRADFAPWGAVGRPRVTREDAAETTLLRTTWVLQCLISPCVPPRRVAALEWDPALVTYRRGAPIRVRWPVLYVQSRLASADASRRRGAQTPWRADVVSLPAVSYRVPPGTLITLLLAAAAILAVSGGVLAYRALPDRRVPPAAPVEPTAPPPTALEQALALLERPVGEDGAADRRRALELVADALTARNAELAGTARVLAWSEDVPPSDETSRLAARARAQLTGQDDAQH